MEADQQQRAIQTIDMEAIEYQKENIQPIKSGRSANQLAALFRPVITSSSLPEIRNCNPINLTQNRKQTYLEFQHKIQVLKDALDSRKIEDPQDRLLADQLVQDPLDLYLQYIRWTIESYPSGGTTAESNLIPLLEQVTLKFMPDERYQQDLRYLKCWLFYVDQVKTSTFHLTNPNDAKAPMIPTSSSARMTLNFLIHRRVGTNFALLYLEYAKLFLPMERLRASPDERDKLIRVLRFGVSQTLDDPAHDQIVELCDQLVQLAAQPEEPNAEARKTQPPPMLNSKTKKKIQVFEDDGPRAPADGLAADARQSGRQPPDTAETRGAKGASWTDEPQDLAPFSLLTKWDNLGTVASNRRQNTLNPVAWKGQKLPMKLAQSSTVSSAGSSSAPSKIKVFEDKFADEESNLPEKDL